MMDESWTCLLCTLCNKNADPDCKACGTPRPSASSSSSGSSSSKFGIPCATCTFINPRSRSRCQLCSSELAVDDGTKNTHNVQKRENNSDDETDDSAIDGYYRTATLLFDQYAVSVTEPASDGTKKSFFRCKIDDKVCRTKDLMLAYIVKHHRKKLTVMAREMNIDRKNSSSSSSSSSSSGKNNKSSSIHSKNISNNDDADAELALQLAMEDYNAMEAAGLIQHKPALKSSSSSVKDNKQSKVAVKSHKSNQQQHSNQQHLDRPRAAGRCPPPPPALFLLFSFASRNIPSHPLLWLIQLILFQ